MATQCDHVLVWSPDIRAFPSVREDCIGRGIPNIERVRDFWPLLNDIDLFCFPDVGQSGLQLHLESIGKAVWGSRGGDVYELNRYKFMRTIDELGLDVAPYTVIRGWSKLRAHLKENDDKYIKISRFRRDMETTHWRSWELDEPWIDWLAVQFGPLKEEMSFLVFDNIETDLEIGGDTYCVDGKWPDLMLSGVEHKDSTYFSEVRQRDEMPEQIANVLDAFSAPLKRHRYRNQFSCEVRVKGEKAYFIDFTGRGGMPSSGSQQLIWKNFPNAIWHGANGVLLQPEAAAKFTIEAMITSKGTKDSWDVAQVESELLPWARFSNCCMVDGKFCFPPDDCHDGELGWLVALGDSPKEVLERAKELADMLPDGLDAKIENLVGLIKQVEDAAKQGIELSSQEMPQPAEVVSD